MPTMLSITLAKKRPGSEPFSSDQASITLAVEVALGADAAAEAEKLYRQAETIVDRQLRLGASLSPAASSQGMASPESSNSPRPAPPMQATPTGRRGPTAISESQRRLIQRLQAGREHVVRDHLQQVGAAALDALSMRQASVLIDTLKAPA